MSTCNAGDKVTTESKSQREKERERKRKRKKERERHPRTQRAIVQKGRPVCESRAKFVHNTYFGSTPVPMLFFENCEKAADLTEVSVGSAKTGASEVPLMPVLPTTVLGSGSPASAAWWMNAHRFNTLRVKRASQHIHK